jgi:hypothetical protein
MQNTDALVDCLNDRTSHLADTLPDYADWKRNFGDSNVYVVMVCDNNKEDAWARFVCRHAKSQQADIVFSGNVQLPPEAHCVEGLTLGAYHALGGSGLQNDVTPALLDVALGTTAAADPYPSATYLRWPIIDTDNKCSTFGPWQTGAFAPENTHVFVTCVKELAEEQITLGTTRERHLFRGPFVETIENEKSSSTAKNLGQVLKLLGTDQETTSPRQKALMKGVNDLIGRYGKNYPEYAVALACVYTAHSDLVVVVPAAGSTPLTTDNAQGVITDIIEADSTRE